MLAFHGLPGSRLLQAGDDVAPRRADGADAATHAPLRFIGVDRPGFGLSDHQPRRTLLDWPCDVRVLADGLGLERFAVLGGSAGGPYALACAYALPQRLSAVAIVNGMAPFDRPGALAGFDLTRRAAWWALRRVPGAAQLFAWTQHRLVRRDPDQLLRRMTRHMAPGDRDAVASPEVRPWILKQLSEAYRQGWRGAARDVHIVTRPWGFGLRDVACPVHLWQGDDDRNVPREMGVYLSAALPRCQARFVPAAGHLLAGRATSEVAAVLATEPWDEDVNTDVETTS